MRIRIASSTELKRHGTPEHLLERAFSLIEIMVVVALLSMIVLGLMAMFSQTQRAFRLGMMQTDVLEAGRMATDILAREIEQTTPSYQNSINFYARIPVNSGGDIAANVQRLPGGNDVRTNILGELFFTTRENQTWTGIGYYLRTNGAWLSGWGPVCTLYRFETNSHVSQFRTSPFRLSNGYFNTASPSTNISKILDGVVHFRVRAYDVNGILIGPRDLVTAPFFYSTNNTYIQADGSPILSEIQYYQFSNSAVPASVEIEIGVLEKDTFAQYRSLPSGAVQSNYLYKHAGNVHLFRQRVAIRNVDPVAYQ
jgi:prepilin-type N-terminal cleavage/methylation domain-containing protein